MLRLTARLAASVLATLALAGLARADDVAHFHHFGSLPLSGPEAFQDVFGIKLGVPLAASGAKTLKQDRSDEFASYYVVAAPKPDPLFDEYSVIVGLDGIVLGVGAETHQRCDAKASLLTSRLVAKYGQPPLADRELGRKEGADIDVAWVFPGLKPKKDDPDARQALILSGYSEKEDCRLEWLVGDASLVAPAHEDKGPAAAAAQSVAH